MTRIYLSGGMTNVPDCRERFAKAEKELTEQEFSVINPAKVEQALPQDMTYEEHMKIDFAMLDLCDGIYMLNGWQQSQGAKRELDFAMAKDMTIIFEGVKG